MHAPRRGWESPLRRLDKEDEERQTQDEELSSREGENGIANRLLKSRSVLLSGEINKHLAELIIKQLILLEEDGENPVRVFIIRPVVMLTPATQSSTCCVSLTRQ